MSSIDNVPQFHQETSKNLCIIQGMLKGGDELTLRVNFLTGQLEAAAKANLSLKKENSFLRSDLARHKDTFQKELKLKETQWSGKVNQIIFLLKRVGTASSLHHSF